MMKPRRPQIGRRCLVGGIAGVLLVGGVGCSGEPMKPTGNVTSDHVHSNADKAFEKLKQDERNRTVSPY